MPEPGEKPEEIDLTGLHLVPDWVAGFGTEAKPTYREHEPAGKREGSGAKGRPDGRRERGWPGRAEVGGPPRRDSFGPPRDRERDRSREPRGSGGRDGRGQREERRPEPLPKGLVATVKPSPQAVEALTLQIKKSGRAFGLFDVAKIVLAGRDRYVVEFSCEPGTELFLYRCRSDGSVWLSREQALRHFLEAGQLESHYEVERKSVDPPKGEFKSVAVCGMCGEILGPPNHHSFQGAVVRMHQRRFPQIPFERYKSRIQIETSEELLEKWKVAESNVTHYLHPKEAGEGVDQVRLESREALERHAMTLLADEIVEVTARVTVPGDIPGKRLAPQLLALLRQTVEPLRTAPFPLVKVLCGALEGKGLRIFKRQGKKLFVSKTRPRALDPSVALGESVRRIVDRVGGQPGVLVKDLVGMLAPRREETPVEETTFTPEETAVLSDLHWLIDEGYVIEYASSALFIGVQLSETTRKEAGGEEEPGGGNEAEASEASGEEAVAEAVAIVPEAESPEPVAEGLPEEPATGGEEPGGLNPGSN